MIRLLGGELSLVEGVYYLSEKTKSEVFDLRKDLADVGSPVLMCNPLTLL